MPWNDVQDTLKALKGQLELANPNLVVGGVRAQMDPAAQNAGMKVTSVALGGLIASRVTKDLVMPVAPAVVAGLAPIIDRNRVAKPDRWSERLMALSPRERLTPVRIGIWDTGVDMALFKAAGAPGMAFDDAGNPVPNLLRDLGEAKEPLARAQGHDQRCARSSAALDTPESRELKARVAKLQAEDAKAFQEDLALAGHVHARTHVAGIAVAGNPFAERLSGGDALESRRDAAAADRGAVAARGRELQAIVEGFKEAGVRVVNMSWRYGPTFFEGALAFHGVGKDPAERKAIAMKLFAIGARCAEGGVRVGARDPVRRGLRQRGQQRGLRRVHPGGLRAAEPHHRGRRRPGGRGDELLDVRQDRRRARERFRGR